MGSDKSKLTGLTFALVSLFSFSAQAVAQVPAATISGPIPADEAGSGTLNTIYSASAIELADAGYIEEEYFIEGRANRYSNPELETAAIVDSDHRYKTRLVVRRPEPSCVQWHRRRRMDQCDWRPGQRHRLVAVG